jgi:AcrR family transcriptional regulator
MGGRYLRDTLVITMSADSGTSSTDLLLDSDDAVREMVVAFEGGTLPCERWTHRAHVGVAVSYLRQLPFEAALDRMRRHIGLYNEGCGHPDGYHETITVLFLRRIARSLRDDTDEEGLARTVAGLAAAYDMNWPLAYYSKSQLWSAAARRGWVEPDLRPLDF